MSAELGNWTVDPLQNIAPLLGVRLSNSANVAIADVTTTALTFDTEVFKQGVNLHSTSTNTSRITFAIPGRYMVGGNCLFAASASGSYRYTWLRVNGTLYLDRADAPPSTVLGRMTVTTLYRFAANDYVELVVQQDSGGALNMLGGVSGPWFWSTWNSA